ncbi:Zn-dependent amino- or carboxypeptidase, M28 family [Fodinibius salinus]|uniref:Zn-dependent amino-or carboxypeptidase, M28 family n=1 Tax=Fodinibius salinus TaxID=860790 RepID=A0A5D3YLU0_9BACT|nr:M20/M25/M40 family metallo-hydrolase [Fodinibius salinus]TYP93896.1 Zn-dependent amino- or carboxypeptidase, M28 family [Fodinibius salinus]
MKRLIFLVVVCISLAGCIKSPIDQAAKSITEEKLIEPIEKLSSDSFKGRATGTEGAEKTVNYLVSKLKEHDIKGGASDSGYVQDVPLVGQKTAEDAIIQITKNGRTVRSFEYYSDFMAWPSNLAENVSIDQAELVYVGYGIQAPEENWDDFKEADVKGKVLVVKNNDPSKKADLFEGKTRLYYGRYDYKYEKAREMGAAGVLIIHTTPSAGYGWNVVANSWSRERFYLRGNDSMEQSPTKVNGWLTKESSRALFESAGLNLQEQLAAAESRSFEPVPLEGLRLNLDLEASYRNQDAQNVLGVVEGTSDRLKDEYLVFTAHHDHLGITKAVEGDSVNNGALDNAAGVSAVLNMARAYKKLQPQLKRSVLFLFVGAEEVGLVGSKYWASNPTVHPGKVTANINLDGMNVYGKTKDLVLVGYGRNTVSDQIQKLAEKQGRTVKPDPHPDRGYFYRSDHFPLAKKGIPAIFPNSGTNFIDKPEGYAETVDSLQNANYHTVNDEINKYWDLAGMVQDVRLFFDVGYRIINAEDMQRWQKGDEFKQARLNMIEDASSQ